MAKQKRGGLGKGLDALLSSAPMETVPQPAEQEKPADSAGKQTHAPKQVAAGSGAVSKSDSKNAVSASASNVPSSPEKREMKPNPNVKPQQKELPVKKPSSGQSSQIDSEGAYAINEDKTTIKGVVTREVKRETPQNKSQQVVAGKVQGGQSTQGSQAMSGSQGGHDDRPVDELDIRLVEPNPDQPRTNFKREELEELAESISNNGLLQPIVVRQTGQKYQIIAGERRYQACKLLGLKRVPVRIVEADDNETIILALIENIQRSDLNPIEEAYGYRRMMERGKMTQTQVAQAVSKGRSTIANALRLLELPETAQQLLFEEKITAGHARAILSIPSKDGREKLTKKLSEEQISVRETEALARLLSGKTDKKKEPRPATPKSYKTVARSLREVLNADVRVRSTKDKNKIEITFKDEADLERLYRLMTSE